MKNKIDNFSYRLFLEKLVIGLEEPILVKNVGELMAKIDSGNGGYNVIHGEDFVIQGDIINFKTHDKDGNEKRISKKVIDKMNVNIGGGHIQERPVIELDIKFAGQDYKKIPFSITDRGDNTHKVLISKDFVGKELEALIDVTKKDIADDNINVEYVGERAGFYQRMKNQIQKYKRRADNVAAEFGVGEVRPENDGDGSKKSKSKETKTDNTPKKSAQDDKYSDIIKNIENLEQFILNDKQLILKDIDANKEKLSAEFGDLDLKTGPIDDNKIKIYKLLDFVNNSIDPAMSFDKIWATKVKKSIEILNNNNQTKNTANEQKNISNNNKVAEQNQQPSTTNQPRNTPPQPTRGRQVSEAVETTSDNQNVQSDSGVEEKREGQEINDTEKESDLVSIDSEESAKQILDTIYKKDYSILYVYFLSNENFDENVIKDNKVAVQKELIYFNNSHNVEDLSKLYEYWNIYSFKDAAKKIGYVFKDRGLSGGFYLCSGNLENRKARSLEESFIAKKDNKLNNFDSEEYKQNAKNIVITFDYISKLLSEKFISDYLNTFDDKEKENIKNDMDNLIKEGKLDELIKLMKKIVKENSFEENSNETKEKYQNALQLKTHFNERR